MTPDQNSAIPYYLQIKRWLLEQIEGGTLSPGDQVPSESELGQRFRLSRGTVRQALGELLAEGHLYLVRGRGTFVAEPSAPKWPISTFVSATDALEQQGITLETRSLNLSTWPCDARVATPLRLESGRPVVRLQRLRLVEGQPLMLDTSYLPEALAHDLLAVDLNNRSLYHVLAEVCGLHIASVDRTLSARLADQAEARLLDIPLPSAVHVLEGTAYDMTGRPVEFSEAVLRSDRSRFQLQSRPAEGFR